MIALVVMLALNPTATGWLVPVDNVPVVPDAQRFEDVLQPRAARRSTETPAATRERYVPGVVVARFKAGLDGAGVRTFCERERVEVRRKGRFIDYHLLDLPADLTVEDAVRRFSSLAEVEFAEPNYICSATWYPNDPYYWSYQWNLQRTGVLDMQLAWELTGGSSSVVVAVVDAGVAYEDYEIPPHEVGEVWSPDGRYHRAPDLASTQFVQGYDCVNDDPHANDEQGHGTHVAGTIAQSTNNGIGVAGMAFGCKTMPVRVLDEYGSGTVADVADGIAFAWQNGAKVINMSLGSRDSSHLIHLAVIDAANAGAVVVAAAGNDGSNQVSYPAAFPECIAVGAVDYWWDKTPYSNWGTALDIMAPGGDTRPQNYWPIWQNTYEDANGMPPIDVSSFDYLDWQGTSMAAPHVSALVAMMMSRGIRNPAEIKARLHRSAIDLGDPGWDTLFGYGLIEPVAALGGQSEFMVSDNYYPDAYWYMNNSQAKFAVSCVPNLAIPFDVTEASALVLDDGIRRQFRLTLNPMSSGLPDLSTNLAGPVTFTTVGDNTTAHWYVWDFAGARRTNRDPYCIVFHWSGSVQPRVGGDSSPSQIYNRAFYYSPSGGWTRTYNHNWYLRAINLKDTLTVGIKEAGYPVAPVSPEGIVTISPQPARRSAQVCYRLASVCVPTLCIVNVAGRVVRSFGGARLGPGRHQVIWDGLDRQGSAVPSGVYFARLSIGERTYTAPVVLLR